MSGIDQTPRRRRRTRRARGVARAITIPLDGGRKRIWQLLGIVDGAEIVPGLLDGRPGTRAQCIDAARPCPWVSCRHHLYLDVDPHTGSIKLNFPTIAPHELVTSCSLDVADHGAITLERAGELMNLTRERLRQIEMKALHRPEMAELRLRAG